MRSVVFIILSLICYGCATLVCDELSAIRKDGSEYIINERTPNDMDSIYIYKNENRTIFYYISADTFKIKEKHEHQ